MYQLIRSSVFEAWLTKLADHRAKARIVARLTSAGLGNLGDCRSVGEGVSEMRIDSGPGYRLYFIRAGQRLIVLLCAGDKSTQRRDIERAKRMAKEWKEGNR
jgi:putative addiction module killer protein